MSVKGSESVYLEWIALQKLLSLTLKRGNTVTSKHTHMLHNYSVRDIIKILIIFNEEETITNKCKTGRPAGKQRAENHVCVSICIAKNNMSISWF